MRHWLVITSTVGCLLSLPVWADEAARQASGGPADRDQAFLDEFLMDAKNPFVPLVMLKKETVVPPQPAPVWNSPRPFVPPVAVPEKKVWPVVTDNSSKIFSDLKVQGVIWGSDQPQAIINNQVVKIGDIIKEARIVNITKGGVDVRYRDKTITLTVEE